MLGSGVPPESVESACQTMLEKQIQGWDRWNMVGDGDVKLHIIYLENLQGIVLLTLECLVNCKLFDFH
jgi:hypothetical protein